MDRRIGTNAVFALLVLLLPSCAQVATRPSTVQVPAETVPDHRLLQKSGTGVSPVAESSDARNTGGTPVPRPRDAQAASQPPAVADAPSPASEVITTALEEVDESIPPEPIPSATEPANAEPDPLALSLPDFEQFAFQNNPTLRQAEAVVRQNQGHWLQVGLYPNPTLGYMGSEVGNNGRGGQEGGFVAQTIVTAHKLDINRAAASHAVTRALWLAVAQRLRVLNDVRIRFYNALAAQRQQELAEELQSIASEGVRASEQLYEAQQVAKFDVLQSQLQLNDVQILLQNARYRAGANWQQLANVAGVPQLQREPLAGDLETNPPELQWDTAWQQLLGSSPLLQAAQAQVEQARCQLKREQVEPIPDLQLQTSVQQDRSSGYTIYGPQIGVNLPIFNRNQGNIAAATAQLQRSLAEISRIELALRDQLAAAFQRYQSARNQVRLYREKILPAARENLELSTQGYKLGEFDFLRVLTARRSYFEANVAYISSLANMQTSAVEIQGLLLTGGLEAVAEDANAAAVTGNANSSGTN
jgi:cobalt-zinc-cadmium efflux system outer membrane protein